MFEELFQNKKPIEDKLLAYGFTVDKDFYRYSTDISNHSFQLNITVNRQGNVQTHLTDYDTKDDFILYSAPNASGAFIQKIKADIERILRQIADTCFQPNVFKNAFSLRVIRYIKEKYGDELEFLWKKFPTNAIWRRKDNRKWYGALLTITQDKLGLNCSEKVEIIDLRALPEEIETLIDHEKIFPGYHMNKKHWITICLDGSVPLNEIFKRIDDSYLLSQK